MLHRLHPRVFLLALVLVGSTPGLPVLGADPPLVAHTIAADRKAYPGVPESVLQLRRSACAICHVVPEPDVLPRAAWARVIPDMAEEMEALGVPLSKSQAADLLKFYQAFSPVELPLLPDDFLPPKLGFEKGAAGDLPSTDRPHVANVNITDLDQDGRPDILVCDELRGTVSWIVLDSKGSPTGLPGEERDLAMVLAPVHSEVFDFNGNGHLDIAVASMGFMHPNDLPIGKAVLLINDGKQNFEKRVLATGLPRLSDMQPGDLNGNGKIDFGLAMFGWRTTGAVGWLEQVTPEEFKLHTIAEINGAMHMELADLDGDGLLDLVVLVSQQHEMILCFKNMGGGKFEPFRISEPEHPTFGMSGFQVVDLDQDGDLDILYSNGDLMDTDPSPKAYHGIQWLENTGDLNFKHREITRYHSCYRAVAVDMDGDGDLDVVGSSLYFNWQEHDLPSLIWLENDGKQNFTRRRIDYSPSNLATIDAGDLNGDGLPDIVGGGMHIPGPLGRVGRVTVWINKGLPDKPSGDPSNPND